MNYLLQVAHWIHLWRPWYQIQVNLVKVDIRLMEVNNAYPIAGWVERTSVIMIKWRPLQIALKGCHNNDIFTFTFFSLALCFKWDLLFSKLIIFFNFFWSRLICASVLWKFLCGYFLYYRWERHINISERNGHGTGGKKRSFRNETEGKDWRIKTTLFSWSCKPMSFIVFTILFIVFQYGQHRGKCSGMHILHMQYSCNLYELYSCQDGKNLTSDFTVIFPLHISILCKFIC